LLFMYRMELISNSVHKFVNKNTHWAAVTLGVRTSHVTFLLHKKHRLIQQVLWQEG
jgi:hypothetical protein